MKLETLHFDPKKLDCEESLFHVANGYLGVRGCLEEGAFPTQKSMRGCYINAFYDDVDITYPETFSGFPRTAQRMINLPDFQTIRIWVNGQLFSLSEGEVLHYRRTYDFEKGYTERVIEWKSPSGTRVEIRIRRMASFSLRELFYIEYTVRTLSDDCEIRFESTLDANVCNYSNPDDPRLAAEGHQYLRIVQLLRERDGGSIQCETLRSGLSMAVCVKHTLSLPCEMTTDIVHENKLCTVIPCRLEKGQRVQLVKYCTMCDNLRTVSPLIHAQAALAQALLRKDSLFAEQKQFLSSFWQHSRVRIQGNAADQAAMDFGLYNLLQSCTADAIGNIAAKGLSGEGYEGHFFWDTEIYMLPFFIHTQPEMAKQLLSFRCRVLPQARLHAKLMGHTCGALFPWRTINGTECSGYFPSGSAQYHINGDIAYSFLYYYEMTGDFAFMAQKGAEVLFETARLWIDAGHYNAAGEFCIDAVTGPDEYTCIVNNNYYTNRTAQANLRGAVYLFRLLNEHADTHIINKIHLSVQEVQQFQKAADAMRLPYDAALDIHMQDDSFLCKKPWNLAETPRENFPLLLHYHPLFLYRHQVCKQADTVLAHYLFEDGIRASTMENTLHYYDAITTHDSSLSRAVFSLMYAKIGEVERAYRDCHAAFDTDLQNLQGNTKDGIHTANMGGAYLAVVAGFCGFRLHHDCLAFTPRCPKEWDSFSFALQYHGSLLQIEVSQAKADFSLCCGNPVEIEVNLRRYTLDTSISISLV